MLLFYAFSGWGSFKILPQYKVREEVELTGEELACLRSMVDGMKDRIVADNEHMAALAERISTDSLNRFVAARSQGRATFVIPEFLVCAVDIDGKPSRVILFVEDKLRDNLRLQLQKYFEAFKGELNVYGLGCRITPETRGGQGIEAMIWRHGIDEDGAPQAVQLFDDGHDLDKHGGWYPLDSDFILQHFVDLSKQYWKSAVRA
ncbi:uncharacterized protein BXZ73DRAFT_105432 [Epithele typhae]|uniref:uncharacterized protein n=1 Tax=Epithele typhae TaxID=378194 RepID=UPI0020088786|nr:uncharacterized protein BXZ73DRAFT_105432 [Epithele typhae]KAH9917911.1 hypothetical protein BXZ73DRAFT_105432 [Epithele typhae]